MSAFKTNIHHASSMLPSPVDPNPDAPSEPPPATSTARDSSLGTENEGNVTTRPIYTRHSLDQVRDDIERQDLPNYNEANDPYCLRSGLKSIGEIESIKANTSRKRDGCVPIVQPQHALRARKVSRFYQAQNESIEKMLKPVDEHVRQAKEEQGSEAMQFKIAVVGSFGANIVLAMLQLYGAASSGSLSLFTTMADAIFDPLR